MEGFAHLSKSMEQPLQWDILVHNLSEAGLQECRLEARATLFVQIAHCIYRNQNMYLSKLQILFVQIKECIFWGSWRIAKVQLSGLSNIAFCPALKLLSVWNWLKLVWNWLHCSHICELFSVSTYVYLNFSSIFPCCVLHHICLWYLLWNW